MRMLFTLPLVLLVLFALSGPSFAVNIDTVFVGDPGNAGEWSGSVSQGFGPERVCGAVDYSYRMGTYEVTAGQYCDFLNHKAASDSNSLYTTDMWTLSTGCKIQRSGSSGSYTYSVAADRANRPVNYVNFWDACRFANWLHNGQGEGSTETGAYTLNNYKSNDGRTIQRNPSATWFVPSEDEWYKAAYYKGGGTNAGYWDYPTKSDLVPSNDLISPDPGNNANFFVGPTDFTIGSPYHRTNVGEFENSASVYGTFDQGGNVREWNEALVTTGYAYRGLRGGSEGGFVSELLAVDRQLNWGPAAENDTLGFRVAAAVPEPSSLIALGSGILALAGLIRRKVPR